MFDKILIANRGEIACRVIRTARRMGIKTVAVYSEADADALHVRMADEAVAIGPAAAAQSYLVIEKIVDACRQTGAQAVHPGYGFLSERAGFAKALAEAGIAFIGPTPDAIGAMGDKIESKKLAAAAKVSTVPGYLGDISTDDQAREIAAQIGYPVMVKASAGGGGKGMRIARNDVELIEGLHSARSEAATSFGDARVFIERYIEKPRHIEIQILGDAHGNIVYLGERECSLQRRHQKVIEEAPSPFIDPETRKAMGEQAVSLAQAVGYRSAGTVEFIMAPDKSFFFLEMNTRLQVEHPVTELVTGLDLVEWMIRVAAGEKLPFTQDDIKLSGWAIEARLYAEDPARNFLPAIGRLTRFRTPEGDGVRVDTGVYEGAEISMHYDPMIAKIIGHGPTRDAAIENLLDALDGTEAKGLNHNLEFLSALVGTQEYRTGDMSTNTIGEKFPKGYSAGLPDPTILTRLFALAAAREAVLSWRASLTGRKTVAAADWVHDWAVRLGRDNTLVEVRLTEEGADVMFMDGRHTRIEGAIIPGQTLFSGLIDGVPLLVKIAAKRIGARYSTRGTAVELTVLPPAAAELLNKMPEKQPPDLSRFLLSPMPGLLKTLHVVEGQEVKAGEALAVVEAMKMENVLRAEADVTVKAVKAVSGASLAVDQVILEFV